MQATINLIFEHLRLKHRLLRLSVEVKMAEGSKSRTLMAGMPSSHRGQTTFKYISHMTLRLYISA